MQAVYMIPKVVNDFFETLSKKDVFQAKRLKKLGSEIDYEGLESFLNFCVESKLGTVDSLTDAYIFLNKMILEETLYFRRNEKYRFSKIADVEDIVYNNPEYMGKYMIGLSISDYIWPQHLVMMRYFEQVLPKMITIKENAPTNSKSRLVNRGGYLEIGPGCGQLLIRAIQSKTFTSIKACDLSSTSAKLCNDYLKYIGYKDISVKVEDFFSYDDSHQFDCIVMGEVLEHVENPGEMLDKIYKLLDYSGKAFISTVINAPAIDHIYLFQDVEQVFDVMQNSGFIIDDYKIACSGGLELEAAVRLKEAINIGMLVKKS